MLVFKKKQEERKKSNDKSHAPYLRQVQQREKHDGTKESWGILTREKRCNLLTCEVCRVFWWANTKESAVNSTGSGEQRGPCAEQSPQHHDPGAGWHGDAAAHRTTFVPQESWLRRNFLLLCEFSVCEEGQTTKPWMKVYQTSSSYTLFFWPIKIENGQQAPCSQIKYSCVYFTHRSTSEA